MDTNPHLTDKTGQKESGRRLFLLAGLGACFAGFPAHAADLDAGGLTFRDFAANDNGASFNRGVDPIIAGGPNQVSSRVVAVDSAQGLARVQFGSIKVELALPLGWQATEDWERGVAYSGDKRYRLIVYENAPKGQGDSEPRTVFDLVMQRPGNPKEGILLTLGVPASDAVRGLKLLALLKQNMRINW